MQDINIVVVQRYPDKFQVPDMQRKDIVPKPPTKKLREQIESRQGSIFFRTQDIPHSVVEVCVQSYFATPDDPSRIGLTLRTSEDDPDIDKEGSKVGGLTPEEIGTIQQSNRVIRSQTSGITQELVRLEKKLRDITRDINQSSRQTREHQQKSLALSQAVRNWPLFRALVLLLGGYLQVSHVLKFMARRHIF